ncbi:hypothetical protein [Janibacter terrae]
MQSNAGPRSVTRGSRGGVSTAETRDRVTKGRSAPFAVVDLDP